MPKKKAKVDNMEDNPHKEDDQMSTTREEESKCENKQILNVSKPGVCNREVKTTDKLKMTFSSLQNARKSNISEKMPQSGVGSMQGKNTGNMPNALCFVNEQLP